MARPPEPRPSATPSSAPEPAAAREAPSFARELERLEAIVRQLEGEELDLDEALALFEEGVARLRAARERLASAEAKVKQVLADQGGTFRLEDFDG